MKKYIQKNFTTILLIVAFTVGLSLLLYPTIANWWNEMYAARASRPMTKRLPSFKKKILN